MKPNLSKYYALYKPFGVLSQFTSEEGEKTLKSIGDFAKDIYPIGRLDKDSEGLLILSNDKQLVNLLLNPKHQHEKEYFVQVEGVPDDESLKKLADGVVIQGYKTLPAKVRRISEPKLPERIPPIRFRKNIPANWLSIIITEGKNRQVRRMTASVGYPTLRLVRVRICNVHLHNLNVGEIRELSNAEIKELKSHINK